MHLEYTKYILHFLSPAGTSRGVLHSKPTYILRLTHPAFPGHTGIGEAPLFPGLSAEDNPQYEKKLDELCLNVACGKSTDLTRHSSIQFGLEQAVANLQSGKPHIWFPSPFTEGRQSITINGLVWMGTFKQMMRRIDSKVEQGFSCIKLKIGAIDWDSELQMIRHIRLRHSSSQLQIRVDANGAFTPEDAMHKMDMLARLGVHSIEQPIKAGQYDTMARLCRRTALPIALDEELIGIYDIHEKQQLLSHIQPQYIILKPALCGGLRGASEWINEAIRRGIGWWVTSALESNIGLTALAQWTALLRNNMPQGLGTGALYANNFFTPLSLNGDRLSFRPDRPN